MKVKFWMYLCVCWFVLNSVVFGAFVELRKATINLVMSVRLSVRVELFGFHWTDFDEILYLIFFSPEKLSRYFKFHQNPTRITGTLHEGVFTFMTICWWILLRLRNVSDKSCWENQNTHFLFSDLFFPEIMPFMRLCRKNCFGAREAVNNVVHACWISKAACTQSHSRARATPPPQKYVILVAFPR